MQRRTFLKTTIAGAALASFAAPRIAASQSARTLKYVPYQDLTLLDPVQSPAGATLQHSCMVFDTLYGMDSNYAAQPQMAEGHVVEDGGRTWKITLREGLRFHNNEPVRATDVVASLKRWGQRDSLGLTLMSVTDELSAPSDRVVQFRLKKPFPLLPEAIMGKFGAYYPAIVPAHLAATPPTQGMPEIIGSGPYRVVPGERVLGSLNVYEKFAGYVPRSAGTTNLLSGPKIAHFERIEWHTLPDPGTAAAALQAGEIDWWDQPSNDFLPTLRRAPKVVIQLRDIIGSFAKLRPNHTQPPFNNPAIRRALMGAIVQADYMRAVAGNDPANWRDKCGFFTPGSPMASDAGMEALTGPRDFDKVKRDLAAAGYSGEKVVYYAPTDIATSKAISEVAGDMFRKLGMNLDFQARDFGSMLQRTASKEPTDKGGWSMYPNNAPTVAMSSPAANNYIRGNGASAIFGWPESPRLESLRDEWLYTSEPAKQQALCRDMQLQAFQDVPYYPLGVYFQSTAFRDSLAGVLPGYSLFYNVKRA